MTKVATSCPRSHWPKGRYRVGLREACIRHAVFSQRFLRTSLPTCAVVGTVLTAINQGTLLASADLPTSLAWQVPLTYSVPFLVSTWSQLRALRVNPAARG